MFNKYILYKMFNNFYRKYSKVKNKHYLRKLYFNMENIYIKYIYVRFIKIYWFILHKK